MPHLSKVTFMYQQLSCCGTGCQLPASHASLTEHVKELKFFIKETILQDCKQSAQA